jgi:5-methylcytosine-specific restriction endonuclease McrA
MEMRARSIASHLKPYSIFRKRRTTIAHAFASALAPTDAYDEEKVIAALKALRQDPDNLRCVYCFKPAETWDHLFNLVKNGESNGYGHQIGNLVPCCRHCNSAKGGKTFESYIDNLAPFDLKRRAMLKAPLRAHAQLTKASDSRPTPRERKLLRKYSEIQNHVLALLQEADACAAEIRAERQLGRWRDREPE